MDNHIQQKIINIFDFVVAKKRLILGICFILVLFIALYLRKSGYFDIRYIIDLTKQFPIFSPIIFILFYVSMVILLVPTFPLNLAAGFLWGTFWGSIISIIACSVGAAGSFLIARYLAFDAIKNRFKGKLWDIVRDGLQKNDWKIVAFTRLNPIFPFGLINYFYGVTEIPFNKYFWLTAVFGLPLIILFSAFGDLIGGFTITDGTSHFIRNIFIISSVITLLAACCLAIKYLQNHKQNK